MNICGIVCEYNPFHNGHLFHINETKKRGADAVICVMSGNFVQRGDFAIMQKTARAEAAIRNGADLVIELPIPWATASAEKFAFGAVSILNSIGVVSQISFGAETEDTSLLHRTASLLLSDELNQKIPEEYATGISYAKAREKALSSFDSSLSEVIRTSNNILGIEYIKALKMLNSDISALSICRHGAAHDGTEISENTASASFIRSLISENEDFRNLIPKSSLEIYERENGLEHAPVFMRDADKAILSRLKLLSPEDFLRYNDVSEGLEFRLFDAVSKSTTLSEAVDNAKTKRYAHSRIRRIFLNAFLGIDSHYSEGIPPYARILAFNDTGRTIIKNAKKKTNIPIITKPSSIKNESEKAKALLTLEKRADDIYSLFMKKPTEQGATLKTSPTYIPL